MTGAIVSLPPLIEQPPGNNASNPAGLPGVTNTAAVPTLAQTWTGIQTFTYGSMQFAGSASGNTFLNASPVASGILTLPAAIDTLVGRNTQDTLTNKTLTNPTINGGTFSGTITGGTYAGVTITGATISTSTYNGNIWTAGTGTLTLGAGKTLTASNTLTFTGTDGSTVAFGAGGTVAYQGATLAQFAATTSAQLAGVISDETGSGSLVFSNSPALTTPNLGTPSAAILSNATGLPISTGVSGVATGAATFLATPSSANLRALLTDETGTGFAYFQGGALGTPASGTATNLTGLPVSTGISGFGTGIAGALAVNAGSAGAPVINGGALGTPSSGALANCTGLPLTGLAPQAAYTIVGNFTSGSAALTASTIGALTQKVAPASSDLVLIQDQAASGQLKYVTVSSLASAGSVASIAGNTGAFTLANGLNISGNVISQLTMGANVAEMNGAFEIWQIGTSVAVAASSTAYVGPDRWYGVTGAAQVSVVSRQAGIVSGSRYAAKFLRNSGQTGTATMRFAYPLITDEATRCQGQLLALSFTAKGGANWSPGSGTLTYNVYFGTGAAAKQSVGFTSQSNPIAGTVNLTTTAAQTVAIAAAVAGSAVTQGEITFTWTPTGTAGADDSFTIDDVRLDIIPSGTAAFAPPVEHLEHGQYFMLCRQVYRQSYLEGTAPGTITTANKIQYVSPSSGLGESLPPYAYTPSMWTAPTVTPYSVGTGAAGDIYDATGAADLAGSFQTTSTDGHAGYTVGQTANHVIWYHYTADARL